MAGSSLNSTDSRRGSGEATGSGTSWTGSSAVLTSSKGIGGDASRNRGIKVNPLPTWAKSLHDDDALFSDPSPSPLTSRAAPRRKVHPAADSISPSLLPQPPPLSKQPSRVERHADVLSRPSQEEHRRAFGRPHLHHHSYDRSAEGDHRERGGGEGDYRERGAGEELERPRRPDVSSRRSSVDFWAGKWVSGWWQPTNPSGAEHSGGGSALGVVDEKGERKESGSGPSGGGGGQQQPSGDWWQFTLPVKYRRKVEDYWRSRDRPSEPGDPEKGASPSPEPSAGEPSMMRQRAPFSSSGGGHPFSMHYPQTPGWSTPWAPFSRTRSRLAGFGSTPIPETPDPFSDLDRRDINRPSSLRSGKAGGQRSVLGRFRGFLLHHHAAPLYLRLWNLVFVATTLACAARIRRVETQASYSGTNLVGVVGSSTTFALVISPPSLIHIVIAVYAEYFGPPLGIWRVSSKMIFTLLELVFISLWSAESALALDDEFTTPLECTLYTPNSLFRGQPLDSSQIDSHSADELCDLQAALTSMVMCAIVLYAAVLVVSLFRIFMKVSRKR